MGSRADSYSVSNNGGRLAFPIFHLSFTKFIFGAATLPILLLIPRPPGLATSHLAIASMSIYFTLERPLCVLLSLCIKYHEPDHY